MNSTQVADSYTEFSLTSISTLDGEMPAKKKQAKHPANIGTLSRALSTRAYGLSDPATWVASYGDYLYRYALIRVRNSCVAEDLVQETLLAALESKDRFNGHSPERAWLTGILRHKICDHFRHLYREQVVFQDDPAPRELDERFDEFGRWKREPSLGPADWGEDAASMMHRKEFMDTFKRCMAKLRPHCATAFVMREMEAADSTEIQETLGISASNYWVLLHRARAQLRLCLEKNWLNL